MLLRFINPIKSSSNYAGAGLSWGGTAVDLGSAGSASAIGMQAELTIGHEMLRSACMPIADAEAT